MVLMERAPHQTANWTNVSPADYLDWKRQSQSFAEFSPYEWDEVNLTGAGEPERIEMVRTAANFFDVLGAQAMLGRVFLPEAERAGQSQTAVLSYGLWQRRFGGDRGIVGKTIKLDGLSHGGGRRDGQEVQLSGERRTVALLEYESPGRPGARPPLPGSCGAPEARSLARPGLRRNEHHRPPPRLNSIPRPTAAGARTLYRYGTSWPGT